MTQDERTAKTQELAALSSVLSDDALVGRFWKYEQSDQILFEMKAKMRDRWRQLMFELFEYGKGRT